MSHDDDPSTPDRVTSEEPTPDGVTRQKLVREFDDPASPYKERVTIERVLKGPRHRPDPNDGDQLQLFDRAPAGWFQTPNALTDAGVMAHLSPAALKVYLDLRRRKPSGSDLVDPSIGELMERLALSKGAVSGALDLLASMGMIELARLRSGWAGRRTWRLMPPAGWRRPSPDPISVHVDEPTSVHVREPKPPDLGSRARTSSIFKTQDLRQQQQGRPAAQPGAAGRDVVVALLRGAKVSGPGSTYDRLAARGVDLAEARVREAIRQAGPRGGGGLVVRLLEDASVAAHQPKPRRTAPDRDADLAATSGRLQRLSFEHRRQLVEEAAAAAGDDEQRRLYLANLWTPNKCPALLRALAELLDREARVGKAGA